MGDLGSVDGAAGTPGHHRYLRRAPRLPVFAGDAAPADLFDVTVVVPTRNEAGNVDELLRRLDESLGLLRAEVLFVDDSDDETPSVIRAAAAWSRRPVRLLHREPGRREGRLGGAVVAGFQLARAPWAVVIDGDLQHPPEVVPLLVGAGLSPDVDLVYGTRYVDSGDAGGLNGRLRELISTLSTVLAKSAFPRRLRGVTDPMSGFFAVRLRALDLTTLRPNGYKVLLEILADSRLRGTVGVPYAFQPRFSGESKASLAEGIRFLVQLTALRLGLSVTRLTQLTAFLAVGLSGVAVNTLAMWCLTAARFDMPYLIASVLATNVAIVWNFVLLETWVFRKVRRRSFAAGFARFWMVNVALLPVQLGLLAVLVEGAGLVPVVANVLTLVVVFFLRYVLTSAWVYGGNIVPADLLAAPAPYKPAHLAPRPAAAWPARILTWPGGWKPGGGRYRPSVPVDVRPLVVLLPVVATLVAFPAAATLSWQLLSTGGLGGIGFIAVCLAAVLIVAVRAAPAAGEPDVHDRQLDVILAVPVLAASIWLSVGWSSRLGPANPWDAREVVAAMGFLAGTSLLLLGTRLTARIRWALCLPLLALPAVTSRPTVAAALIAVAVIAAVASAVPRLRDRRRPAGPSATVPPPRSLQLPSWRIAGAVVAALAVALAVNAIGPDLGSDPTPASQHDAGQAP